MSVNDSMPVAGLPLALKAGVGMDSLPRSGVQTLIIYTL